MKVVALRRSATGSDVGIGGTEFVASLPELLAQSDHAVLALPLTAHTRHIINTQSLAHAKPGLHLVNIARGALIDQPALLQALDEGRLSRATLDVTYPEPLPDGHPLYHHPRVRLTPHISWSADGTAVVTARKFVDKLARFVAGQELDDQVDFFRGY
ncbi:MAG: NAD(P)-dependent oxidoreductase [Pseudomonadota bacterium]